ncbi:MAG: hypothetical protein IPJ50_05600 [Betaproteobacteria bacterium]|nr:hypothetical protein [Betaproteobacteria bacterium]
MIYVALLLAVALIGGLSAVGLKVAQTLQQRSAEAELLAIGQEFRNALQSYAEATQRPAQHTGIAVGTTKRPTQPGRQTPFAPPLSRSIHGKAEWGIVRGPDQRIFGIHSLSNTATFKRENFPVELAALSGSLRHADWVFAMAALPDPQQRQETAQIISLK